MTLFTAIDLSGIPAPTVVETLSYESIFADMLTDLQERDATFTALVESDPAYKILEVAAYRELLIRQRVNDASRAVMLAYATGSDLDNLAALFGVTRFVLDPGNPESIPPVSPTYESNTDLRRRAQLALEGFTTAGSEGSYIFHGLSAHAQVKDIGVSSPVPGEVTVTVLSRLGNGTPTSDITDAVAAALNAIDVRPLTDNVTVEAAEILNYSITATLYLYPGPDPALVQQTAYDKVVALTAKLHKIGQRIPTSGLISALHVEGVERVVLEDPEEDITPDLTQAAYCTGISIVTAAA